MDKHKENATLTKKEEKLIVTLFCIAGAIVILGIGYLIATAFIEFPWEKNAPRISHEEFEVRWLSISNKIFLFAGISGGIFIGFNLIRFIINKLIKRTLEVENAKTGIVVGSLILTVSYLAYFLTNYKPGHSSSESNGSIVAILILFIIVMFITRRKQE